VSERGGISGELRPYVDADEVEALDRVGVRLTHERPVPSAGFRAELEARLTELLPPTHLRLAVATYLASGVVMLAAAAMGLADIGPLAP
jgi:hypothetical protein